MKERILTSLIAAFVLAGLQAQAQTSATPRLVVGLTIDQFRADYMEAFSALYGERGFKKLLKEGRIYYNAEYDFINVDRSSAVASIYTGTTPYYNGIVGNNWMDRSSLRIIKAVDDPAFMGIYTSESTSPARLTVSTLSDELMVATCGEAETYSIAPTREMAVLAAGHASKGAFWLNDENGKWCGSTYYGNFPQWVTSYNDREGLDFRIGNIDIDNLIDLYAHVIQSLGLRNGSRETVQDETVCTVIFSQTLLDDTDYYIIRHQLTIVNVSLCFETHFCTAFQRSTDNVTRGNCWDFKIVADNCGLCALSGTRSAEKYDIHFLTSDSPILVL